MEKSQEKKASAFKESVEPLSCLPFELINVSNYRQREMEGGHNHSMLMPVGRQWSTGRQGRDSKHQAESAFSSSLGIRSRLMLNGVFFFFTESGQLVFSRRSFQVKWSMKGWRGQNSFMKLAGTCDGLSHASFRLRPIPKWPGKEVSDELPAIVGGIRNIPIKVETEIHKCNNEVTIMCEIWHWWA